MYSSREVTIRHMQEHFPCGEMHWLEVDGRVNALDAYVCPCGGSVLYVCAACGMCLACRVLAGAAAACEHVEMISTASWIATSPLDAIPKA